MRKKLWQFQLIMLYYSTALILFLHRDHKDELWAKVLYVTLLPYYLIKFVYCFIYEKIIGNAIIEKKKRREQNTNFEHDLAIVAIIKNESQYLKEWLDYHIAVGIRKFFLYDNESNETTIQYTTLKPYIDNGLVEYIPFPGKRQQLPAYNHAIKHYKNKCKYLAMIDADEFIFSEFSIFEIVDKIINNVNGAAGIGVNWCMYGSGGQIKQTNEMVTKRFIMRAKQEHWVNMHLKTIVNPRLVSDYISPHYPVFKLGAFSVNTNGQRQWWAMGRPILWDKIRINHYFCKSWEEWLQKQNRGFADKDRKHDLTKFEKYDLNDVEDTSIKDLVEKLNIK